MFNEVIIFLLGIHIKYSGYLFNAISLYYIKYAYLSNSLRPSKKTVIKSANTIGYGGYFRERLLQQSARNSVFYPLSSLL